MIPNPTDGTASHHQLPPLPKNFLYRGDQPKQIRWKIPLKQKILACASCIKFQIPPSLKQWLFQRESSSFGDILPVYFTSLIEPSS
jgi:hypothetical protein